MITNYLDYVSLASRMAEYHRAYHRGEESPITDPEYDQLRKELIQWEKENPDKTLDVSPTFKVGSIPHEKKNDEFRHEFPMLSLENALNADEFKSWLNLWLQMFGPDVEVIGEFKYDGMALSLLYIDGMFIRALTRGDGEYGEDVTRHAVLFVPSEIPVKGVVEVRGEAIVKNSRLEIINMGREKYANARAAVVGLLSPSRKEVSCHTSGITFIPYELEGPDFVFNCYTDKLEILKELGYTMLSCFVLTVEKIQEVFDTITDVRQRGDIQYEIDGMVFKINDIDKQMKLGETNHAPRHMFAYKFPPITGECRLLEVVFQVGRSGEIAPVAKITATALMGVVVTSVLLHNEDRMRDRGIAIGNTYEVYRSGDVIPHMGKLVKTCEHPQPVEFPDQCPSCGSPVVKHGAIYYCENTHHCPAQKVAALAYAVSRDVLDVEGMAEKTIQLLLDNDLIRSVADIFTLDIAKLATLPGYTEFSANKLWYAIVMARETTFDRYLMALGIEGVGKATARSLARRIFKRSALFELNTPEKVLELKIPDIGNSTASSIAAYFSDPQHRIEAEELLKNLIIPEMGEISKVPGVVGKTFVFTGRFSDAKDVLENKVLAAGGYVGGSISHITNYLVVGDRPGSKLRKAKVLGTECIDERTFLSLFENTREEIEEPGLVELLGSCGAKGAEFQQLPNGLYVGYHVEGCETFELAGSVPLSMETLRDDRPLFLSHSDDFWFPNHLPEADFKLYEIQFSLPKEKTYNSYKEYQKVNPWFHEESKTYIYSKALEKLIDEGYHMFSVGENEKKELPESFIINPTQYVKSIKKIVRASRF